MQAFNPHSTSEQGYQFVTNLMERQDEVLEELEQLNERIESMIRELSAQRAEDAAQLSVVENKEAA